MKKVIEVNYKAYNLLAKVMDVGGGKIVPLSFDVYLSGIKINNHVKDEVARNIETFLREYCKEISNDKT
jgi:hypothetical protein